MTQTTVVIADDTPHIRLTLNALLDTSDPFRIIAEAENGVQAIEQCIRLRPDVLLLDLSMPVMDGFAALVAMRRKCPTTKVIVFSGQDPRKARSRVMRLGASGFITKGNAFVEVWKEVFSILASQTSLPTHPLKRMWRRARAQ